MKHSQTLYKEGGEDFAKTTNSKQVFQVFCSRFCYYTYLLTTLSVGFQMATIYPALLVDLTSSATHDQPRDKSKMVAMRTTAADHLVHTKLNPSNILAFIERQIELLRCYSNKKKKCIYAMMKYLLECSVL